MKGEKDEKSIGGFVGNGDAGINGRMRGAKSRVRLPAARRTLTPKAPTQAAAMMRQEKKQRQKMTVISRSLLS